MHVRTIFNDKSKPADDLKNQLLLSSDENELLTAGHILAKVYSSNIYDSCDYLEISLGNKNEKQLSDAYQEIQNKNEQKEGEPKASTDLPPIEENNHQSEGQDKNMHLLLHFNTKTQSGYAIYQRSGFIQEEGKKVPAYKFHGNVLLDEAPEQQNAVSKKRHPLTAFFIEIADSFFNWANSVIEAAKKKFVSENKHEAVATEPEKKTESEKSDNKKNTSTTAYVTSKGKTNPGTGRKHYLDKHDVSSISSNFGRESNFRQTPPGYGFPDAKKIEDRNRQLQKSITFKVGFN